MTRRTDSHTASEVWATMPISARRFRASCG